MTRELELELELQAYGLQHRLALHPADRRERSERGRPRLLIVPGLRAAVGGPHSADRGSSPDLPAALQDAGGWPARDTA